MHQQVENVPDLSKYDHISKTDKAVLMDAIRKLGIALEREMQLRAKFGTCTCSGCVAYRDAQEEARKANRAVVLLFEALGMGTKESP